MVSKCSSAAEAVAGIGDGESIWIHSMAATPVVLLEALAERARSLTGITAMQLHLEHAEALADPRLFGHLRNRAFFASQSNRRLINEGHADYVPAFLSEIPKMFRRGEQPVDTVMLQVSPPDRHGLCSLGISVEATKAACDCAKRIVAHINPNMPRTHGDAFIALDAMDAYYECAAPLAEHAPAPISAERRRIGEIVAGLIEDGDCLQMGIGAIPDAVLACLGDRRHLGIHTEMFSDGAMELIGRGVIDNSRKQIHPGKTVTGFVMGSHALYDFVDDNPEVVFLDIEYVNNPAIICRNRQVVSINSAIQIDLSGQVCADSIGSSIFSGFGGQLDFVLGAQMSERGKSVIALPATALDGRQSRIVPTLSDGAGVVTTRAHVDYIVTEFGAARLRGRSLTERARSLIDIAHPDFRESLERDAHRIHRLE